MSEFLLNSFIVLFVVLDPVGVAPIFAALTHGGSDEYRKRMAMKGSLISGVILVAFAFVGHLLLNSLGISLSAFRIAGGLFLLLLAIDMVFARQSGLRSTTQRENAEAELKHDISVFPLAIPLIAGPGAITTMLLLIGEAAGRGLWIAGLISILLGMLLLTFFALVFAGRLMRLIGETGSNVISRVLGILLAALAVQYMIDGIKTSFFGS